MWPHEANQDPKVACAAHLGGPVLCVGLRWHPNWPAAAATAEYPQLADQAEGSAQAIGVIGSSGTCWWKGRGAAIRAEVKQLALIGPWGAKRSAPLSRRCHVRAAL